MQDDLIVWQNIITMTACTVLAVTYAPLAFRFLTWGRVQVCRLAKGASIAPITAPEIVMLAVGIVLMGIGTWLVRGYSFMMREYDLFFLSSTLLAPAAIGMQALGASITAGAYYVNPLNRKHYRGLIAGAIMFALLVCLKVLT